MNYYKKIYTELKDLTENWETIMSDMLREVRADKLDRNKIAEEAGINPNTLNIYLTGRNKPSTLTLVGIMAAINYQKGSNYKNGNNK